MLSLCCREGENVEKNGDELGTAIIAKAGIDLGENQKLIQNMVYVIRGKQVMLDSDLAALYQVETKRLNEAVKRNMERFPLEFRFQLTEEEFHLLRSQFATSKERTEEGGENRGGRTYLPYAFTEQGIAMLSAVLKSKTAIQVSINIMNTFVVMRKFMGSQNFLYERMNELEVKHLDLKRDVDNKLEQIFNYIAEHEEVMQKVFFDGQVYDAFSLFANLAGSAVTSLILIDNYVDLTTLNILAKKRKNVSVCIYTAKYTKLTAMDIAAFNNQYPKLEVKITSAFHDRFLILDREKVYHVGASLKDAGKKCFAVSLLDDDKILKGILHRLKNEADTVL